MSLINAADSRPRSTLTPFNIRGALSRIEREARGHKLSLWSWLAISTATVMSMNSPESIIVLYRYTAALKPLTERVAIAEFMREIGLRCTGINGVCLTIII
jgi:hypothetical protein